MGKVLGDHTHPTCSTIMNLASILELAVGKNKSFRPGSHDPCRQPLIDEGAKCGIANGEELGTVVEPSSLKTPSGQPPAHASAFVDDQNATTPSVQTTAGYQARNAGAHYYAIGMVGKCHVFADGLGVLNRIRIEIEFGRARRPHR
jgi:hypothetical protein